MRKVKIIYKSDPRELEEEINKFIEKNCTIVYGIHYQMAYGNCMFYSALIEYEHVKEE